MSQSNLKAFISFGLLFFISPVIWAGSYSIEGELEVIYVDYFTPDTSELIYQIKDKNGLATQLTIPDSINKDNLETGLNVKVSGVEAVGLNRSLNSSALINSMEVEALDILPSVEKMTMEVSGVRKAVVLMVDFNDKKSSDVTSIEKINGMMYTNAKSTNQIYKESSFDKIRFEPDSDGDGKSDIFHVELNYDAGDSCDYNKWANDAEQAAENMGVDLGLYQHKVTVLSNQVSCGWGGLGHLGCGSSCRAWVKWHSTIVYAHELGHNLRMHHASTDPENDGTINSEYGDHSGIMGNNTSVRQVNGPHRIQMDWYSDLPDQIHAVTYDTTLQLYPLENNPVNGTQGLQIIEIPKLEGSEKYYLTYRKNTGTFGMASTYRDKVNVHRFSGGATKTAFIKALSIGESFQDPENKIEVIALDTGGESASVQINVAESDQDVKITNASFLSIYNRYLSAKNNGGSGLHANGNAIGPWETFDIVLESSNADPNCIEGGDSVSIDTQNGYYALVTQKGGLNAKASSVSKSETFIILRADNGSGCIQSGDSIVLQSSFGKYVGAKKNGRANAKLTSINNRALFTLAY